MTLTAELSLYPLADDYIPPIQSFIEELRLREGLTVVTNAMSTQLRGEHGAVMNAVSELLARSAERYGPQVLVCKFIPSPLDIEAAPTGARAAS
jgi:uncharacterized protein YqgV (UPF0045/DUF77 family)